MSKERARLRAAREAERAKQVAVRQRAAARRQRRRELVAAVTPRLPDRRRAWLLGRRSPGQRVAVAAVAVGLAGLVWYFTDSWPTRIGFTLLLVLLLPVVVIVVFDRRM